MTSARTEILNKRGHKRRAHLAHAAEIPLDAIGHAGDDVEKGHHRQIIHAHLHHGRLAARGKQQHDGPLEQKRRQADQKAIDRLDLHAGYERAGHALRFTRTAVLRDADPSCPTRCSVGNECKIIHPADRVKCRNHADALRVDDALNEHFATGWQAC